MASLGHTQLNETLELLNHPDRRYILYHLQTAAEPVAIESLAARIVRWERTDPGIDAPRDTRTVETMLRHTHLPKLEAAGVIAVSPNPGHVTLKETGGVDRFLGQLAAIDGRPLTSASD